MPEATGELPDLFPSLVQALPRVEHHDREALTLHEFALRMRLERADENEIGSAEQDRLPPALVNREVAGFPGQVGDRAVARQRAQGDDLAWSASASKS